MLVPMRNEQLFYFNNPRHYVAVKRNAKPTKNMTKDWHLDSPETYSKIFNSDWPQTGLDDIISDRKELKKLLNEYFEHMEMFLDIFHHF